MNAYFNYGEFKKEGVGHDASIWLEVRAEHELIEFRNALVVCNPCKLGYVPQKTVLMLKELTTTNGVGENVLNIRPKDGGCWSTERRNGLAKNVGIKWLHCFFLAVDTSGGNPDASPRSPEE
mmetsp:Transcript_14269/g.15818  ORF Transcript_14269/g.15818 Transcript_14269/m.15818 type:complete len:122 (-) Transcript_14269:1074-1439(-)